MYKAYSTWQAVKSSCFPWLKKFTDWLALWASRKSLGTVRSKESARLNDEEQNCDIGVHLYRCAHSRFEMGDGLFSSTATKNNTVVEAHGNEGETTWVSWWVVDSSLEIVAIVAIRAELNELRVGDKLRGVDWTSLGMRRVVTASGRSLLPSRIS